ncbi:8-amino-7-oxononanoate synthase [Longirhabdus pacifica]|uniref:8-amino-7-oxononanoate synthase n=1 Tax=Longirhabdus pacifica TaxID=2305227 RepID=UPI001F0C1D38|nr:8-amino-7-oxononanoate synthase [Longirhabdus pacifica]
MSKTKKSTLDWMHRKLDDLQQQSQYRTLTETTLLPNGWLMRNQQKMLNLASNDYLGLSLAPIADQDYNHIQSSASNLVLPPDKGQEQHVPIGAAASRLISGHSLLYETFEQDFAAYKQTESALIFNSGYMANIGVISAIVGRGDIIFSDRLNHASIIDGSILSRAEVKRYRHGDLDHLQSLLEKAPAKAKKLIISDSIFSMDGTVAPIASLVELKNKYGAMLMIDEAHSGGVYGKQGEGLVHELGLTNEVEIHMGTFSKAFGSYGAYIAGDQVLKDYLINHARSFIYTTAMPPQWMVTLRKQWQTLRDEQWRREALQERACWFRNQLQHAGLHIGASTTHIIPVIVGGNEETLQFAKRLQEEGIAAVAIRPPTVRQQEARIRFTLMSVHQWEDLQWAVDTIITTAKAMDLI